MMKKMSKLPSFKQHLKKDIKEDKMDISQHKKLIKSIKKPKVKK